MRFDKVLSSALDTMIDHPSIRYAGKFAKPFGHLFKLAASTNSRDGGGPLVCPKRLILSGIFKVLPPGQPVVATPEKIWSYPPGAQCRGSVSVMRQKVCWAASAAV